MLQIDFPNDFNSVKRSHFLKATGEFIPGIATFACFCYFQITPIFCNNAIIQKELGVKKVDWLGPFLFSLTLWPIIHKIKTSVPSLLQHFWYLDDGFFAGSEDQIKQTLEILANEGPERGQFFGKDGLSCGPPKIYPSLIRQKKRNSETVL